MRELRGNPGKRPLNRREPKPAGRAPSCPRHLGKVARAEWRRVAPMLTAMRVLTEVDRAALAAYCVAWQRWVESEEQVAKLGTVVKTVNGNLIQNPYLAIADRAMIDMAEAGEEFRMTPSSRSGLRWSRAGAERVRDFHGAQEWNREGCVMSVASGSKRSRAGRSVESFESVATTIGPLEPGMAVFAVTRGQWSMIDAIMYVLDKMGGGSCSVWTWTIAEYEIEAFTSLLLRG
ncbi:MAG: phage terminase small subunit P27 family [Rhodospirillales bacterium]|nr:phage terminase small subunit P27 family [Rhodospirillales bacterium]